MDAKSVFPITKQPQVFTLILVVNHDEQVLLGLKKRGFGAGKWNGFGGKVEEGESIKNCAIRSVLKYYLSRSFLLFVQFFNLLFAQMITKVESLFRELQEECGLVALSLHKHGIVWFDTQENPYNISEVHLFTVDEYEGEISESEGWQIK